MQAIGIEVDCEARYAAKALSRAFHVQPNTFRIPMSATPLDSSDPVQRVERGWFGQAASRAGELAVIHLVPLLITYRLGYVSRLLGLSFEQTGTVCQSLAVMTLVQCIIHSAAPLPTDGKRINSMVSETIVFIHMICCEHRDLTLNRLQYLCSHCRSCRYSAGTVTRYSFRLHGATAIMFLTALWHHVRSSKTLG